MANYMKIASPMLLIGLNDHDRSKMAEMLFDIRHYLTQHNIELSSEQIHELVKTINERRREYLDHKIKFPSATINQYINVDLLKPYEAEPKITLQIPHKLYQQIKAIYPEFGSDMTLQHLVKLCRTDDRIKIMFDTIISDMGE